MTTNQGAVIGVDVGGTHSDVEVCYDGRWARGKALTTYDDFSAGVLGAIDVAASRLDLSLAELLDKTDLIVNGTTVVTNAVTQLVGSRVGVLVTAGFRDTFRLSGGPRLAVFDDHLQVNVPDLTARNAIVEIFERTDAQGNELRPLDEAEVRAAARHLVEDLGVEAFAVCFLSSYCQPEHELQAERQLKQLYPELFVTLSHRVYPVMGETRRWTTAIMNSFVQRQTKTYLDTIDSRLRAAGFAGSFTLFQGLGGGISKSRAERLPLTLLGSGPAAGAIGARRLAQRMGYDRVLLGDMGGTSFDTAIVIGDHVSVANKLDIGPFQTGVNIVDVTSVGSGGGSIVAIGDRGVPRVGPRSAGSTPGPACYGRGGTDPTVTDAMVVLGLIDVDNYLGGRVQLQPELAATALETRIAAPLGWNLHEAAAAVYELVVTDMANALREVSVSKGHDPRDSVFLAYGGSLGLFAWEIADAVGVREVCVPAGSSVFCARGLLTSDLVVRHDQAVNWCLDDIADLDRVNQVAKRLVQQTTEDLIAEGGTRDEVSIRALGDFKFRGQAYELSMALPTELRAEDIPELVADFHSLYERTYGEGTPWEGVPPVLVNFSVVASLDLGLPQPSPVPEPSDVTAVSVDEGTRRRDVFLPHRGEWASVPVIRDDELAVGRFLVGPAVIDVSDTTIFVPDSVRCERDTLNGFRMRRLAPNA